MKTGKSKKPTKRKKSTEATIMTPVAELSRDDTIAHYNAVLIEHMDSKFDLLIEGFQTLKSEVRNEIRSFRNEVNNRFDLLEAAIKCNAQGIRELQTSMARVEGRIDEHEDRATCLEGSRA